jgi:hypothetical protein
MMLPVPIDVACSCSDAVVRVLLVPVSYCSDCEPQRHASLLVLVLVH